MHKEAFSTRAVLSAVEEGGFEGCLDALQAP